jgi:hypothetical protein
VAVEAAGCFTFSASAAQMVFEVRRRLTDPSCGAHWSYDG